MDRNGLKCEKDWPVAGNITVSSRKKKAPKMFDGFDISLLVLQEHSVYEPLSNATM